MQMRVLSVELSQTLSDIGEIGNYDWARVLVRFKGHPLGCVMVRCKNNKLLASDLNEAIEADPAITKYINDIELKDWLLQNKPARSGSLPGWTLVICTRDRTEDLKRCLEGLLQLHWPAEAVSGEILIVDNAPSNDLTRQLVASYPVTYAREERPGLNWARSRGAALATGEIVIYTDDDVVVEPDWVSAILEPFRTPRVAAVTGLTLALELETYAQKVFELSYGGFSRGYNRIVFDYTTLQPPAAGKVGAGANVAIRRELINKMGLFEVELDCGTIAKTGGDSYAFYRLLAEGYQIVYNPDALVWHRHRREYAALRSTLEGYTVGGFAFLTRCLLQHGDWSALTIALSWLKHDHIRQLYRVLRRRPNRLPLDLALVQIRAVPKGIMAYFASRKIENNYKRLSNSRLSNPPPVLTETLDQAVGDKHL
jgi:glycosyltransferase involved in cell wall biosynthesis